jgi:hypothetical protein
MPWTAKTRTPGSAPSAYTCDVEHPFGYKFSGLPISVNDRRTEYTIYYTYDGVTAATLPGIPNNVTLPITYTNIGLRDVTVFVKAGGSEMAHDVPKVKDGSGGGPRRG